jgi:predicted  nucleic acid-binding Zn-ribbon protein
MTACNYYKEAPKCIKCGKITTIVSQTERYCEFCNSVFELSDQEREDVKQMRKNGLLIPEKFINTRKINKIYIRCNACGFVFDQIKLRMNQDKCIKCDINNGFRIIVRSQTKLKNVDDLKNEN